MSAPLTLYTTSFCGPCKRLKVQLDDAGISYVEINIEEDTTAADFVAAINNGNQTVPTLRFADDSTLTNPSLAQVSARLAGLS